MAKKKQEFISNQGQRGPELELGFDELNEKEQKVLQLVNGEGKGTREAYSIWDIVYGLNWQSVQGGKWRGNSWVRNCLRRLVRGRLVERVGDVGDGMYQISLVGRRTTNRALGIAQTKRKPKATTKVAAKKKATPAKGKAKTAAAKPKRTRKAPSKPKTKPAAEEKAVEATEAQSEEAPAQEEAPTPLFPEQQAASA